MDKFFVLMVGLPGSGKSTFVQKHYKDHVLLCPDNLLVDKEGRYSWTIKRSNDAWAEVYKSLGLLIMAEAHKIIFDATNINKIMRSTILNIMKGAGYYTTIIYMNTPLEICMKNNEKRSEDRKIPALKIETMERYLQIPTKDEADLMFGIEYMESQC